MASTKKKQALMNQVNVSNIMSHPRRTRGVGMDHSKAEDAPSGDSISAIDNYLDPSPKKPSPTPAMDLAGKWTTTDGFSTQKVHTWITATLANQPEHPIPGPESKSRNQSQRILGFLEAEVVARPRMSAQEFKVLLERIDYYTNPRNASLDPLGGERYQVFRTKGKRVNDKNRVSKREQKSKRKKRKEQRREVRGLGDLLEQLDIQGGLATERREKKAGQGAEGGSKDMQVHASLHASLLPDDCSMEMS